VLGGYSSSPRGEPTSSSLSDWWGEKTRHFSGGGQLQTVARILGRCESSPVCDMSRDVRLIRTRFDRSTLPLTHVSDRMRPDQRPRVAEPLWETRR
jgi:hypothetical protein